jgi:hypothetical protein
LDGNVTAAVVGSSLAGLPQPLEYASFARDVGHSESAGLSTGGSDGDRAEQLCLVKISLAFCNAFTNQVSVNIAAMIRVDVPSHGSLTARSPRDSRCCL